MKSLVSRRTALVTLAGTAAAAATATLRPRAHAQEAAPRAQLKGNINHSVCRWCYNQLSLDELCRASKAMGIVAIDLLNPHEFETVKRHDLTCSLVSYPNVRGIGTIARAFNRVEHHDTLVTAYEERLKQTADAGFTRLICFSGNRAGLDDEQGLKNCEIGLKRLVPTAERLKVTLIMELLNSKRNHGDYQCDRTAWGAELVRRVGSERFKLLYDIFHMQIMEGDICDTIRENHQYFDHYHTGGVPGRAEIDETQELQYPRIMRAVLATGFKGYVAQEFVPQRPDPIASLRQAIQICDV